MAQLATYLDEPVVNNVFARIGPVCIRLHRYFTLFPTCRIPQVRAFISGVAVYGAHVGDQVAQLATYLDEPEVDNVLARIRPVSIRLHRYFALFPTCRIPQVRPFISGEAVYSVRVGDQVALPP